MEARLIAIAGPLRGAVFPLAKEEQAEFSIGRSPGNTLSIEDPSVSRRHCVLKTESGGFCIVDRGSVNRTYVNGLPTTSHLLRNGDEVKIGESLFLFVTRAAEGEEELPPEESGRKSLQSDQTLRVRTPESDWGWFPPAVWSTGYLKVLFAVGEAISSAKGLEDLQRNILESVSWVIPAERSVIVLAGDHSDEFASIFQRARNGGSDEPVELARALLEAMARRRKPILRNGAARHDTLPAPEGTSALVAVPLVAFGRLVGVLCLTSSDPKSVFGEDHLRFLEKLGAIAAAALDDALNARNRAIEEQQRRAEVNLHHNMVGESQPMRKVYEVISRVAPTDSTVLICGESGTGKELVARAIHRNSHRSGQPFVAINCAALTETLLESELFGHEKGAFTGAVAQKKGKLEEAFGGTVFLDEIGETSPFLQAKLLRVLQEREFERVGGTRTIKADIRVIAATNRNLEEALNRGSFRPDLYYRLNVVSVTVPPLRERREDIPILATHFAQKHSRNLKRWIAGISGQAHACMKSYDWPGNVRELENVIERALVLGAADMIQPEDLPDSVVEAESSRDISASGLHATIREMKKQLVVQALQRTNGNYTEAAKLLDLHPNSLHRMIRNLNVVFKLANSTGP